MKIQRLIDNRDYVTPYPIVPDPELDGITHVNIYSKSPVKLGRWTSNFAHSPFSHAIYGDFMSMEAYYFWHATGQQYDSIRPLHGWVAKEVGSRFPRVRRDDFTALMREGLECKVMCNYRIAEELTRSWLPFQHYYYYRSHLGYTSKMVMTKGCEWLIYGYTDIRQLLWLYNGYIDRYIDERRPEYLKHLWKSPQ